MTRFKFRKQESNRYKRVSASYRRPRGFHSKMREHRKGNLRLPEAGFRAPVEIRGLHPCGLHEILVFNQSALASVDPKIYAIRISSNVSHPKKMRIAGEAKTLGVKVLNPPKEREKKTKKVEAKKSEAAKKPAEEAKPKTETPKEIKIRSGREVTDAPAPVKEHHHGGSGAPAKQTKKAAGAVAGGTEK